MLLLHLLSCLKKVTVSEDATLMLRTRHNFMNVCGVILSDNWALQPFKSGECMLELRLSPNISTDR